MESNLHIAANWLIPSRFSLLTAEVYRGLTADRSQPLRLSVSPTPTHETAFAGAKIPAVKEFADTGGRHRTCLAAKRNNAVYCKSCWADRVFLTEGRQSCTGANPGMIDTG